MPDGGVALTAEFFHIRQEGAFKPLPRGADGSDWLADHRHELDPPPIEATRNGLVVVSDPAPSSNPDHQPRSGVGVEHVLSEYTLRAAGIYRPEVEYPTLGADDAKHVTVKNHTKHDRTKEQNRAPRGRSRIVRDGNAPKVDPETFAPEARWAVDLVNLVSMKRYSPPEVERVDGKGRQYGATTWLASIPPEARPISTWIFRHVSRSGGGSGLKKKFTPRTISKALATSIFPANMQIDGDAPTPIGEGIDHPYRVTAARFALASRIVAQWSEHTKRPQWSGVWPETPTKTTTAYDQKWRTLPRSLVARQRRLLTANLHNELCLLEQKQAEPLEHPILTDTP